MKKIILTGDRPTGKLHLGHYVGSLQSRLSLQEQYFPYVMIADVQALTDHFENPGVIQNNIEEVMRDYLAVGIDPSKTTIFLQSHIEALTELTVYFLNLVTLGRLERNPTVKAEIQQKGFSDSLPVGFLCYPVSQAADIALFHAELVPVGDDQLPMIEQTNEIVRKFNRIYKTEYLKECTPMLSVTPRLVGIDGQAKAGKSLNNAIFLADSEAVVKEKVMSMFTDPNHLRISDPGKVEGNVVFAYLDAFHTDKEEIAALKDHYRRGGLGDIALKNILNTTLQHMLSPIREKRFSFKKEELFDILHEGTRKARNVAQQAIRHIRVIMGIV